MNYSVEKPNFFAFDRAIFLSIFPI